MFNDFAAGELDAAVNEAFRTVEIEVRQAASLPEREDDNPLIGKKLMYRAFMPGRPLSRPTDSETECQSLVGMFVGAMSYFRNPAAYCRRTSEDVLEATEELIFASRLLRLVEERRSAASS